MTTADPTERRPYRLLITGSRSWPEPYLLNAVLAHVLRHVGYDLTIVHGACPTGADDQADLWASNRGLTVERHPAAWDEHGKAAGPLRNSHMVSLGADLCIAFVEPQSRGTRDCLEKAREAGIPVWVIEQDAENHLPPPPAQNGPSTPPNQPDTSEGNDQ